MIIRHQRDYEIIEMLRKYGPLKREQLIRYWGDENTKYRLKSLLRNKEIKEENGFIDCTTSFSKGRDNQYKAFELLIKFKNEITSHYPADYPFTMIFSKDNKLYDVAVIDEGQEVIQCDLINRTGAKNIIAIIKDEEQAIIVKKMIDKEKNLTFLIIEEGNIEMLELYEEEQSPISD